MSARLDLTALRGYSDPWRTTGDCLLPAETVSALVDAVIVAYAGDSDCFVCGGSLLHKEGCPGRRFVVGETGAAA